MRHENIRHCRWVGGLCIGLTDRFDPQQSTSLAHLSKQKKLEIETYNYDVLGRN